MEYRSRRTLLGLPLLHIATSAAGGKPLVARGWIAIGDTAFGVLIASGGVAVGGVAFGGIGLGVIVLAGVAGGALALGGIAVGEFAFGAIALGWTAAAGGIAIAHDYAVGALTYARHANDVVARRFFQHGLVPALGRYFVLIGPWVLLGLFLLARALAGREERSRRGPLSPPPG